MWRTRVILVVELLVLAALPESPEPEPAPPATVLWGEEAVRWFEAHDEAARLGIANLLRFVAPEVVRDDTTRANAASGLSEYGSHLQGESGGTLDEESMRAIYLDTEGALVERAEPYTSLGELTAYEIGEAGTIIHESETAAFLGAFSPAAVRALADAYLEAWSTSDAEPIRALYSDDIHLRDSLLRVELTGTAAVVGYARDETASETSADGQERHRTGLIEQAVFFRWLYNDWLRPNDLEIFILTTDDDRRRCPGQAAVALQVSSGLIVSERRYHEIESVRRCWDTERRPDGWWTGLRAPAPYEDVVTGTLRVGGQRIEIHNGTAELERLVQWAMRRFEAADLPAPSVASVTFEEDANAPQCSVDRTGLTIDLGDSAQLFICLAQDDACAGEGCTVFRAAARLLVLHELAHAWMHRQVDQVTQRTFMDHMGSEEWSSADVDWYDRGVEQAAQVIAWGLMDEQVTPIRLGERPCRELVQAFRLLTDGEPPRDACSQPD